MSQVYWCTYYFVTQLSDVDVSRPKRVECRISILDMPPTLSTVSNTLTEPGGTSLIPIDQAKNLGLAIINTPS